MYYDVCTERSGDRITWEELFYVHQNVRDKVTLKWFRKTTAVNNPMKERIHTVHWASSKVSDIQLVTATHFLYSVHGALCFGRKSAMTYKFYRFRISVLHSLPHTSINIIRHYFKNSLEEAADVLTLEICKP